MLRLLCCRACLQLDPENTGFIPVENFTSLVEDHELRLDPSKLEMLFALVHSNEEGQVCYRELIELVSSCSGAGWGGVDEWAGEGGREGKDRASRGGVSVGRGRAAGQG